MNDTCSAAIKGANCDAVHLKEHQVIRINYTRTEKGETKKLGPTNQSSTNKNQQISHEKKFTHSFCSPQKAICRSCVNDNY